MKVWWLICLKKKKISTKVSEPQIEENEYIEEVKGVYFKTLSPKQTL